MAILTMATLTIAILTMATLTMAILTMATLTMTILTMARDRHVEQRVVEGRAEREQGVHQQQEVTEHMQPQPTGRDLL